MGKGKRALGKREEKRNSLHIREKVLPIANKAVKKEIKPFMKTESREEKLKDLGIIKELPVIMEWFNEFEKEQSKIIGKGAQQDIKIKPAESGKREMEIEKIKAEAPEKPAIEEPVLVEWFRGLEEKQRELAEFLDKSFKEAAKKVINKSERKDQEIAEIRRELEYERSTSEKRMNEIRHELEEKKKLIQELQGKLGKIISELK